MSLAGPFPHQKAVVIVDGDPPPGLLAYTEDVAARSGYQEVTARSDNEHALVPFGEEGDAAESAVGPAKGDTWALFRDAGSLGVEAARRRHLMISWGVILEAVVRARRQGKVDGRAAYERGRGAQFHTKRSPFGVRMLSAEPSAGSVDRWRRGFIR